MTVMIEKRGIPTIPDLQLIVKDMPPALVAGLRHVLHDAIADDNAVVLELYVALLNEYDSWDESKRHEASGIFDDKYFTEEAAARHEKERHEALAIIANPGQEFEEVGREPENKIIM